MEVVDAGVVVDMVPFLVTVMSGPTMMVLLCIARSRQLLAAVLDMHTYFRNSNMDATLLDRNNWV